MRISQEFTPFFRSSIGFDRALDLLESALETQTGDWPPYDIVKTGDETYRIIMATPGFGAENLTITQEQNELVVSGAKTGEGEVQYLHRGMKDAFEHRFELADYVMAVAAKLENGMLIIDLARDLPERMKPRKIQVQRAAEARPKLADAKAA